MDFALFQQADALGYTMSRRPAKAGGRPRAYLDGGRYQPARLDAPAHAGAG
jgi:hypothetical protein